MAAPSPAIATAVSDASRPATDTARDAARKPAEMLAFAGVKPGDKVLEILPSGGYFTRVLSKTVGPSGVVYAAATPTGQGSAPDVVKMAATPEYANIRNVPLNPAALALPEPVDVIWTAQNYHDFHLTQLALDVPAVDRQLLSALKPGGVLMVIDHVGAAGTGHSQANTLHRIEPAAVRKALEAAGFVFAGESDVLRNPADDLTGNVFSPAVRGKTDQFVYKFRRPT